MTEIRKGDIVSVNFEVDAVRNDRATLVSEEVNGRFLVVPLAELTLVRRPWRAGDECRVQNEGIGKIVHIKDNNAWVDFGDARHRVVPLALLWSAHDDR